MNRIQQVQESISQARGGCIAVRAYDINGTGHIEAEIDRNAANYCGCEFCKAGDMTTSQAEPERPTGPTPAYVRELEAAVSEAVDILSGLLVQDDSGLVFVSSANGEVIARAVRFLEAANEATP